MGRLELTITDDAIAIAEFSSMPAGLLATDAATKASAIQLLFSGTVHPGKFLLAFQGGVAETELAVAASKRAGRNALIDAVHLPFPHPQLRVGVSSDISQDEPSLIAVETLTTPSMYRGLDQALKGTDVKLRLLQLSDHLGGKSIAVIEGALHDVEVCHQILEREISALLIADIQIIRRPSRQFTESFVKSLR